ncbi:MAG: LEA type 2 family protein [Myxococcota bacterium]
MLKHAPVALLFLFVGCKSGPEITSSAALPELVAQELTVPEQGLSEFRLRLSGAVKASETVTIEKATYELVVEEKVVSAGEELIGKSAAPTETGEFVIERTSRYVGSAEELAAMSERGGSLLAAVRGKLFVRQGKELHTLDYARSREIRVPRLPTVKLHELDAARYSADEANATFYLGVVNPNPFPVKLDGLSYAIEIGGKKLSEGVRGQGEKVSTAATGVFEVQVAITQETYGPEVNRLIKSLTLPYVVKGQLQGDLFQLPYELRGDIKLNVSK